MNPAHPGVNIDREGRKTRKKRSGHGRWAVAPVLVGMVVLAQTASARELTAGPLVQASGADPSTSPFVSCPPESTPGITYPNSEVEPWIAVNPLNRANIVGMYQQDRWSTGSARGLVASVSFDFGSTWTQRVLPGLSTCSGGTYDRATDPWLTFAPNGDLYGMSLSTGDFGNTSAMLVNKSVDGGLTWSAPTTLIRDTDGYLFNDKNSITADPFDANFVYAVWDRSRFPSDSRSSHSRAGSPMSFRSDTMFARTTDGGRTWEPARAIHQPRESVYTLGHQIVVLPNGDLVDVFASFQGNGNNGRSVKLMRSTDRGRSWTEPLAIEEDTEAIATTDPDDGEAVRTSRAIPDVAVDRANGSLYVVWEDSRFGNGRHNGIALAKSTDGGFTWSEPLAVNSAPEAPAFTPSVEVAADGTLAVTYYDFRRNTPDPGTLPTDYWMVHSHDGGTTWQENHLGGSFDMQHAPVARGLFLGDYQGLASDATTFVSFFSMAQGPDDPATVHFRRLDPVA